MSADEVTDLDPISQNEIFGIVDTLEDFFDEIDLDEWDTDDDEAEL